MMEYLPKDKHQTIAVLLYVALGYLARRKTAIPLALLFMSHCFEYIGISRKLAKQKNIKQGKAVINTLIYGFTWWRPIKEGL